MTLHAGLGVVAVEEVVDLFDDFCQRHHLLIVPCHSPPVIGSSGVSLPGWEVVGCCGGPGSRT